MRKRTAVALWAALSAGLGACGHFTPTSARTVAVGRAGEPVSQAELQQDLQRFTGRFADSLVQSAAPLADPQAPPKLSEQAMRRVLLYESAALDIATGQLPELNLLDMLVFVTLARESFERYWQPEVFGERGEPMRQALTSAERDAWQLARKVMTPPQEKKLHELIADWRAQNPKQVRIEAVRLSDFSKFAGNVAKGKETRGLMASVKSATRSADEALLLGERAMFLAQRMPFLLRMQARIGAQELLSDSRLPLAEADTLLSRTEALLQETKRLRPLLEDASGLVASLRALTDEARLLAQSVEPLSASIEPLLEPREDAQLGTVTGLEQLVASGQRLSESMRATLQEARALTPTDREAVQRLASELDRTLLRWLVYLGVLGTFLSAVFWTGFYLVKRTTA